jgi:hypothetical protein
MAKDKDEPVAAQGEPAPAASEPAPKVYRVLVADGIAWENKRARYGSKRSDIPATSIRWLLKGGYIEEATDGEEGDPDADV